MDTEGTVTIDGNQAAATSKLKGFLEGLRVELSPIPESYTPAPRPSVGVGDAG